MNNASVFYFPLRVSLREDERDALVQMSMSERRDPRAQAALLIRRALENAGYLTTETAQPKRQTDIASRNELNNADT